MEGIFDLTRKTAIVTGGAGFIGIRLCRALAKYGANVAILDTNEEAADDLAKDINGNTGYGRAVAIECDVSSPPLIAAAMARVLGEFGDINILVNNAATKGRSVEAFMAPFEDYRLDVWREIMAVNLDGMFLMAQAVGKRWVEAGQRGGSIIMTSSIYGIVGPDFRIYEGAENYAHQAIASPAVYSASKAGVIWLTRYLATYWGPKGIRVNALVPGGVASGQNSAFKRAYADRVPLRSMADAGDMCGAVIWLASYASDYVTGQTIVVDGGLTAW